MRFLISRLSSLGDVACTLPVAVALRKKFPDCEITWVVSPAFADVVRSCSAVNTVIEAKPKFNLDSIPKLPGCFDAALDMQGLLKSAVVVGRVKANRKLGYHWQREGAALFSAAVTPDPSSIHVVDQYVDVARALGAEMGRAEFGLTPNPDALEAMRSKLPATGFVAINAGAGWVTKRWPAASFAEVIKGIPIPVVLIGGPDAAAREAGDAVIASCTQPPIDMVGKTSVAELIALISLASAHLGGDTGSTHIAAALGIPAVGLYSITRPERCCPYGQFERTHYDPAGLHKIQPQAVLNTLLKAVNG